MVNSLSMIFASSRDIDWQIRESLITCGWKITLSSSASQCEKYTTVPINQLFTVVESIRVQLLTIGISATVLLWDRVELYSIQYKQMYCNRCWYSFSVVLSG